MTKLSVNVNKVATIRNARGGNVPNLCQVVKDCEKFGAQGITVHPRPDERHIRKSDVFQIKEVVTTELNIEGYPSSDFIDLVLEVKPQQVTLVPDAPEAITSNAGWDTLQNREFLKEVISSLGSNGIRSSLFIEADEIQIEHAAHTGTDRIELYTEDYARTFPQNREEAIGSFAKAAATAKKLGLGVNAGHDLNLQNLKYFKQGIPNLLEVSIGHALISDALYYGLQNTIQLYLKQLS
jgi:pyridoxine 5-phosphate synthase